MALPGRLQFVRFCVIGGVSAVGSLALLYLLADVAGLHYLLAFVTTFVVANALAYAASRRFAFAGTAVGRAAGLLRHYAVTGAGLGVNLVLMYLLVDVGGVGHMAAAALLSVLYAPLNYLLHRRITFGLQASTRLLP